MLEEATKKEETEEEEEEVEEKKGQDESEEEIEYPVPQARKFMASMGFKSFDEVKDGRTLVHICCQESQQRNVNIRCSSTTFIFNVQITFQSDFSKTFKRIQNASF